MENTLKFPGDLSIADFDYPLPKEKIAFYPLEKRDHSKLLVFKNGEIRDNQYFSIVEDIPPLSIMVFNESKVVQARLRFFNENGGAVELFCLEPSDKNSEIHHAMQACGAVEWRCLVGDLRKWKQKVLTMDVPVEKGTIVLNAELMGKESDSFVVKFYWNTDSTFAEVLTYAGKVPLPPYIKRGLDEADKERYQTIYAKQEGSVAAPTAGLHFTPHLLNALKANNVNVEYITLHVGAGTFKPVKAEKMSGHDMHSEQVVLNKDFLYKLLNSIGNNVVAVGTTSARTLESLYWLGLKIYLNHFGKDESLTVGQWDPYELEAVISPEQAIGVLIEYLNKKDADILIMRTSIIIAPGYSWQMVDVLATNFHQPKSTLMLLVASFVGESWRRIYDHALTSDYRFLSYGDGSLLFRK